MNSLEEKTEVLLCPKGHSIAYEEYNVGMDFSDNLRDADGMAMFEWGFYCMGCKRVYGLSKLRNLPETKQN
jgi:hypothetical protein